MAWVEVVALSSLRMAAFLIIAPPFSNKVFPASVKAMLSIGIAIALAGQNVDGYETKDTVGFLLAACTELIAGFALGFLVFIIFSAIPAAGDLIDLFGGFQIAQAYDPQMNVMQAQFGRLFQMTALALLFASGAYQIVILGLTRSFDALPIGVPINMGIAAESMITAVSNMFIAALQIAGPLLVVLFLADAGLGLLTRVAPALNAFSMSFPLKIFITLALIGVVYAVLPEIVASLTGEAAKTLLGVTN